MVDGDDIGHDGMENDERAAVSFPFDRMTVQRFRETFPRARWSDRRKAWLVPGKTARRRIDRWMAREESRVDPYADAEGRDAFAFEPILSPYLGVDREGFRITTPYSRKLVEEIRQVPFARWDGEHKIWRVPFASYEDLVDRWQVIETEAQRCEPEERRKRAEARKGTDEDRNARRRAAERERRRIPLHADDLPPPDRPIATTAYGIVVVSGSNGELVEPEEIAELYPGLLGDHVWATWRTPSLDDLSRPGRRRSNRENEDAGVAGGYRALRSCVRRVERQGRASVGRPDALPPDLNPMVALSRS